MLSCVQALCDPIDCNPPGSSVRGIFQARILEWVAISFSRGSSQPRDRTASLTSPALAGGFFTSIPPGVIQQQFKSFGFCSGLETRARFGSEHGGLRASFVAQSLKNLPEMQEKVKLLSCVQLFATPWTVAYQAFPSVGFSRQEY